MSKNKDIKTYGFGVVAQGLHNYLVANNEEERLNTIIIKNEDKVRKKVNAIIEITNEKTVRDKDMGVIVELISSPEEAYGIVAENLEIGKKVISANKKLIAENLRELINKEKNNKATFLYEGAVCGSIPIIRILNDLYANESVKEIKGIFNGSSNYILSQLFSKNISYDEALFQAQNLGFAEADPSSDVGGYDALYKLIIITAHAFGKIVKPHEILNIGIESISKDEIDFAKKYNLKIKLIAKVVQVENQITITVLPTLIRSENDLFNVENEYNGIVINSDHIGEQFYKGKGAGSLPTGAVVYSDLKAIDKNYNYSYKKLGKFNLQLNNEDNITVILNVKDLIKFEYLDIEIKTLYPIDVQGKQFIAKISIEELLINKYTIQKEGISIIAIENEKLIDELLKTTLKEEVFI
jgi:homoserine dehydrogenase